MSIPGTLRRRTPPPPPRARARSLGRGRSTDGAPCPRDRGGQGATRCFSRGRRGAEKRCLPSAFPESSPTSRHRRPSTRRASTERPGNRPGPALSSAGRSGRRTRRSPRPVCWAEETRHGRGEISFAHCGVLFPRRILRIPRRGPGGAPAAARIGGDPDLPIRPPVPVPVPVPAAGGDEPVPVRQRGPPRKVCRCSPPLLDRFLEKVLGGRSSTGSTSRSPCSRSRSRRGPAESRGESSAAVRRRVDACRTVQEARYAGRGIPDERYRSLRYGGPVAGAHAGGGRVPHAAAERLSLSGRSIGKACRVARTISDLAAERRVALPHAAEALQYRLSGFGTPGSPRKRGEDQNALAIALRDEGASRMQNSTFAPGEHGNFCHPLFRKTLRATGQTRAENQTNRGSRFGQKPIPNVGGKKYRRRSRRMPAPAG